MIPQICAKCDTWLSEVDVQFLIHTTVCCYIFSWWFTKLICGLLKFVYPCIICIYPCLIFSVVCWSPAKRLISHPGYIAGATWLCTSVSMHDITYACILYPIAHTSCSIENTYVLVRVQTRNISVGHHGLRITSAALLKRTVSSTSLGQCSQLDADLKLPPIRGRFPLKKPWFQWGHDVRSLRNLPKLIHDIPMTCPLYHH